MKKWKLFVTSLALIVGIGGTLVFAPTVTAVEVFDQCKNNPGTAVCEGQQTQNATNMVGIIINTLLYVIGIIAVIMIVVGGIRYTLSGGNASQVKEAKDTILYAAIGLIIAIMSYSIVNFVLKWFQ